MVEEEKKEETIKEKPVKGKLKYNINLIDTNKFEIVAMYINHFTDNKVTKEDIIGRESQVLGRLCGYRVEAIKDFQDVVTANFWAGVWFAKKFPKKIKINAVKKEQAQTYIG